MSDGLQVSGDGVTWTDAYAEPPAWIAELFADCPGSGILQRRGEAVVVNTRTPGRIEASADVHSPSGDVVADRPG
ncbi:hypothetical protein SEA_ROBSFEET_98 [Microbacterium phage RobsFeet]|uniref:Uncharacterized protein n=1 Tax=Microbacterium phage RobsFeet TaxID=2201442 RepID=A0A4P8VYP8_9CAUD|nr:hypothetical protein HOT43_gp21 [Microbacterium phage RobsFeet]QCS26953.1 hypothetical protein SEA_ROBSFEET_98 [Microbacterium phage RobsFeet]